MTLTNMCDRSQAYMLKEINYSLATIIILCHTLFWSPNNAKDYWWCDALACWCHHHPRKCEAKRKQGNKDEKKLKFASAMETAAHDKESESE